MVAAGLYDLPCQTGEISILVMDQIPCVNTAQPKFAQTILLLVELLRPNNAMQISE